MPSQPSFEDRSKELDRFQIGAGVSLLAALNLLVYLPALRGSFLWDDDSVLSQGGLIQAADGIRRIWFSASPTDYWPVTNSAFWIEWRLWGAHPLGYHWVNVILHGLEAVLWWRLLWVLRLPGAFLAALLFAVHPVNVESVAWIAEQKNLWAMGFALLCLLSFVKSERLGDSGVSRRRGPWYALSLAAFVLALLSKGSVATLPLVVLGLIMWKRRPTRGDLARLAPFFLVSGLLVLVDVWFQTHGTGTVIRTDGPLARLLGAGAAVAFYLEKAVWPTNLAFVYPDWTIHVSDLRWWIPLIAVLAVSGALWKWSRPAFAAWGYFCVMLIPVMGFTDVVFMKYSLVADRYQHLAIMGVLAFAAASWAFWYRRARFKGVPIAAVIAVVACLTTLSMRQSRLYRDPETLFIATLAQNPDCWMAYDNLGVAAFNTGRVDEAIRRYHQALQIRDDLYETHSYLGNALQANGQYDEAIIHYKESVRLKPDYAEAYSNWGAALTQEGRPAEAVTQLLTCLRLKPDYPEGHNNYGAALARLGRWKEAEAQFAQALKLNPDYAEAKKNLEETRRLEERNPT